MTDLVPHSPGLPALRDPSPVHQAVRDQLVEEIGQERIEKLLAVVDAKTFTAILHWLSGAKRSSVATKRRYAEDIVKLAEWACEHFGIRPVPLLSVLTFDDVTVWTVYARSQGIAVSSQRRILAAVSSLFGKTAVPRGWAEKNPVSFDNHAPAVGKTDNGRPTGATRVLPPEDLVKMLQAAQTNEEHLVHELLFDLGLRVSEVVNLRAENIDRKLSPAVLHFQRKRGKWSERQLPADLLARIDTALEGRAEGPILLDPATGRGRTRHQVVDITRRLARHGGVPHPQSITPHVLRATAITELLNAGEPLQQVQKWADHDHASTTQGYWLRSNGIKQDAALTAVLAARVNKLVADAEGKQHDDAVER